MHRINMRTEHHGVVIYYQHFLLQPCNAEPREGEKNRRLKLSSVRNHYSCCHSLHWAMNEAHIEYLFMHKQEPEIRREKTTTKLKTEKYGDRWLWNAVFDGYAWVTAWTSCKENGFYCELKLELNSTFENNVLSVLALDDAIN